jgi:hypothetical protein
MSAAGRQREVYAPGRATAEASGARQRIYPDDGNAAPALGDQRRILLLTVMTSDEARCLPNLDSVMMRPFCEQIHRMLPRLVVSRAIMILC